MAERIWLEITVDLVDLDDDTCGHFRWQWRGGRCVSNGTSTFIEDALLDALDALREWEAAQP